MSEETTKANRRVERVLPPEDHDTNDFSAIPRSKSALSEFSVLPPEDHDTNDFSAIPRPDQTGRRDRRR